MSISRINLALAATMLSIASGLIYWHTKTSGGPEYISTSDRYVLGEKEIQELTEQAMGGDSRAAVRLAQFHDKITFDRISAARWWELAAKQGNADAQYYMGFRLMEADDGRHGHEACEWFKLAAQRGSAAAERRLQACGKGHATSSAKK